MLIQFDSSPSDLWLSFSFSFYPLPSCLAVLLFSIPIPSRVFTSKRCRSANIRDVRIIHRAEYNLSKHESQCKYRHSEVKTLRGERFPKDHRKEEVYAQPEDNVEMVNSHSDASEIAATTEEFYTAAHIGDENSNSPAPASSEVLNDTIILSLSAISRICGLGFTDDLIATLRDDAFSLEMFRERVQSATPKRRVSASIIQNSMKPYEFLTKHFKDEPGMFVGTLYYFDAIEVLRKQISLSNNLNTKYLPVHPEKFAVNGSPLFDHPLNTAHSVRVFKSVREEAIVN